MTALNARGFPVPKPWRPRVPDYRPAPLSDPGKPGRWPANDPAKHPFRNPFRNPVRKPPGLMRKLPGALLRRFPLLWPLMLPDFVDPATWFPPTKGKPPFVPTGNWTRTHGPYSWPSYGIKLPLLEPAPFFSNSNYPGRISGQAISHHTQVWNGSRDIGYWWYYGDASIQRSASYERWARPDYGVINIDPTFPGIMPTMGFPAAPGWVPVQGVPETYPLPGALPGPAPVAVPPQLQPYAPPRQWPDQGGYAAPVGLPSPFPPGLPSPPSVRPPGQSEPAIPPAPGYVVGQSWEITPSSREGYNTQTRARQQTRRRRDRARKNERKAKSKIVGRIWKAIGSATEAGDMIDIAFASLPKSIRQIYGKNPTPYDKALAVYRHWEVMDMNEFIHKLIANQIEDAIYGLWGRFGAKASEVLGNITGRPVGINQGSTSKRYIDVGARTKRNWEAYQQFNAGRRARGKRNVTFRYWAARYREEDANPIDDFLDAVQNATRSVYDKPYNARAAEIDLRQLT